MNEFLSFARLGFTHVAAIDALDHILFLMALAAIYQWRQWREAVWVITAFTVGHSITLALVVTGAIHLPVALVEFLIPMTIIATAIDNIARRGERPVAGPGWARLRPLYAAVFGLIHGAGFASYLQSLFVDHIAVPLFGFNVGIEIGQLLVLTLSVGGLVAIDAALRPMANGHGLRVRVVGVSTVIALVATRWAVERAPW